MYSTMQTRKSEEKPGKLYTMCGNKPSEVSELFAGDIGAIAKLANTRTGDTLSTKGKPGDVCEDRLLRTLYIYEIP